MSQICQHHGSTKQLGRLPHPLSIYLIIALCAMAVFVVGNLIAFTPQDAFAGGTPQTTVILGV